MPLPQSVQEIAEVIGEEAALYLVSQLPACMDKRYPNSEMERILYVPKKLTAEHKLVQILGFERASQLVKGFGGERLKVANCNALHREKRDREIRRLAAAGTSNAELARMMKLTERRIRGLTREIPREGISTANDH